MSITRQKWKISKREWVWAKVFFKKRIISILVDGHFCKISPTEYKLGMSIPKSYSCYLHLSFCVVCSISKLSSFLQLSIDHLIFSDGLDIGANHLYFCDSEQVLAAWCWFGFDTDALSPTRPSALLPPAWIPPPLQFASYSFFIWLIESVYSVITLPFLIVTVRFPNCMTDIPDCICLFIILFKLFKSELINRF